MLCKKYLNDKKYILHDQGEKVIEHLTKTSFSVLGGNPLTPLSTLKFFFPQNILLFFCYAHKKIHSSSFQDFVLSDINQ